MHKIHYKQKFFAIWEKPEAGEGKKAIIPKQTENAATETELSTRQNGQLQGPKNLGYKLVVIKLIANLFDNPACTIKARWQHLHYYLLTCC